MIIPQPNSVENKEGHFVLNHKTGILVGYGSTAGDFFRSLLQSHLGIELQAGSQSIDQSIIDLVQDINILVAESYILEITSDKIHVKARGEAGILYGLISLFQLISSYYRQGGLTVEIPCMIIKDSPRFSYRGFMLDEGRHFQGKETVKRLLDIMAIMKLNHFHWHLTEDQGWRIEIKKYPELTSIGSKRERTMIGGIKSFLIRKYNNQEHSGYYTQEEILEIIAYASQRGITVIPEIDLPGHSSAMLAAYPQYGCTGGPYKVQSGFGIFKDILCAGKLETYTFVENILDEICKLFPSDIIHIGGDEAPKARWKKCEQCQKMIKEQNLGDEEGLRHFFTSELSKMLRKRGKRLMGWNEILSDQLDRDSIAHYWMRGRNKVLHHLRQDGKVVMSDFFSNYLDYNYHITPLRKTYAFDPIPKDLEEKFHGNVLGIEAPLWTEWVSNQKRLDWQVFPRLVAMAENAWTKSENKNYDAFRERLEGFYKVLDLYGVNYAHSNEVDPSRLRRFLTLFKIFSNKTFDD